MYNERYERLPGKLPGIISVSRAILVLLVASSMLIPPATLRAADLTPDETLTEKREGESVPWRGSAFIYRNTFSAYSLDHGAELTFNPYYAMIFSFRPYWWFTDHLYVRANFDVITEVTESDITTYSDETLVGDLTLTVGYSNIYTIPVAGISISADLLLRTPTSKASQARTMILGIGPGVRLSRSFDVLKGISLLYSLRAMPAFHRYTTSENETPLIHCIASEGGCGAFVNTGVLNSWFRLQQVFSVSVGILDWLSASVSYGLLIDWLYDNVDDERVSLQPQEPQDRRYASLFEIQVAFEPMNSLQIGLGLSTVSPQLAPDSEYYNPLFNRYSTIFIDLQLNIDGVIEQIKSL